MTALSAPRTSGLAVFSFLAAIGVPALACLAAVVIGLCAGMPIVGFLIALAAIPGLAMILLLASVLTFAAARTAAVRIRENPALGGRHLAGFAQLVAIGNGLASFALVITYVALPISAAWTESIAWRKVAMHGVDATTENVARLASAADSLRQASAEVAKLPGATADLVASLRTQADTTQAAAATIAQTAAKPPPASLSDFLQLYTQTKK